MLKASILVFVLRSTQKGNRFIELYCVPVIVVYSAPWSVYVAVCLRIAGDLKFWARNVNWQLVKLTAGLMDKTQQSMAIGGSV